MKYLGIFVVVLLFFLHANPARADLYPLNDRQLSIAASKYRQSDYIGAREAALKAPFGSLRELMLGISSMKQEKWKEAAEYLSRAEDFALLADYALFYKARALSNKGKYREVLTALKRFINLFPNSPLLKEAMLLHANSLFDSGDFENAFTGYQKFIEKFPSGSDSLEATYKSALCMENMGDTAKGVQSLRTIWLKYPSSIYAAKADADLQRIAAKGISSDPFSSEELFRRAMILYDVGRFDAAAKAMQSIPLEKLSSGLAERCRVKTAVAMYRARRYKDAESALFSLVQGKLSKDFYDEAIFWLAKCLDKNGREYDAVNLFLQLSDSAPLGEWADKALLEAALIRKNQKKVTESINILKKLILDNPVSSKKETAMWEIAWISYQAREFNTAAEYLKPLSASVSAREKALYWFASTQKATGNHEGAQKTYSQLTSEYPSGYYTQTYKKEFGLKIEDIPFQGRGLCELLPVPNGHDRVKALITLGMYSEARKELAYYRKKPSENNGSNILGIARLYLEMKDYNGAYNLLKTDRQRKIGKDSIFEWGICFPAGFSEFVEKLASEYNIPASLVYSVIHAESGFLPTAVSPAGAVGLMQLMPATAETLSRGSKSRINKNSLVDPERNITFGVRHLRDLLVYYNGDQVLAIAAYNAGSGNVNRWKKSLGKNRNDEFIENIPFLETREYVKRVLANAEIYRQLYRLENSPDQ
jgi:soluble lytic murein transglycosylase